MHIGERRCHVIMVTCLRDCVTARRRTTFIQGSLWTTGALDRANKSGQLIVGVPVWMLDRVACATLSIGPPRCSLAALCNLRRPALAARVPPRRLREVSLTSLLGGRLLHPRLATIL